ncbi:hypothetical protein ACFPZ0_25310 [Streptomonospora nanhaiensis]|uniref:Uncharacterized protein n=1 Tax=Streptomonospora nanhaiensis TaxID=1323731 RepID=A0A853BKE3_9ACTN|nr:hypothetical protein [Streptomonospora nanhaiensis]MBX9391531.1 hypothetical protein [Streptomonospora nanhaiensis]NYI95723.1 hypothetical protein [Streptomonospora nanhaiensis]
MDETTGSGPLHAVDDTDWSALAPGGHAIPGLLHDIAGGEGAQRGVDDAVPELFDLIRFPGPGYLAAPRVAHHLISIACHPGTPAAWRSRPLSLLLELLAPTAAVLLPEPRDPSQWRDEVAWAAGTDLEKVRDQYRAWFDDASDEQRLRHMAARIDTVARDQGVALLQAEREVHDTVRERVPDLLRLLDGGDNRRGIDSPAEWACYILAFVPEAAAEVYPALLRGVGTPADLPGGSSRDLLSAELFALGMLAPPDDPEVTVALAHVMASGHLYNAFAAAVALVQIHGERAPREALTRIGRGGRTNVGYRGLFGDSWPHCGELAPAVLGFLALGRAGRRSVEQRIGMLPDVLAGAEGAGRAAVVGAALEMVLGPRTAAPDHPLEPDTDLDQDTLKVLWSIADIPAAAWTESAVGDTVQAWGLPEDRTGFRVFAGVDDAAETDAPDPAGSGTGDPAASAPAPAAAPEPQGGGLLSRLFGGGR